MFSEGPKRTNASNRQHDFSHVLMWRALFSAVLFRAKCQLPMRPLSKIVLVSSSFGEDHDKGHFLQACDGANIHNNNHENRKTMQSKSRVHQFLFNAMSRCIGKASLCSVATFFHSGVAIVTDPDF